MHTSHHCLFLRHLFLLLFTMACNNCDPLKSDSILTATSRSLQHKLRGRTSIFVMQCVDKQCDPIYDKLEKQVDYFAVVAD